MDAQWLRRWMRGFCVVSLFFIGSANSALGKPPIDPNEARPHIDWKDADQLVGRTVFVSGQIVSVSSAGRVNFLNFDSKRPGRFTGIVYRQFVKKFPKPLNDLYEGKYVRIRGMITTYAGRAQVQIASPDQIEILPGPIEVPRWTPPKPKPVGDTLKLATFNVLNLFDDRDDPYHSDETTRTKPREEMEHLAAAMRKLDADVLALEEVESRGYLTRFLEVFGADLGYRNVVHFEGNDLRGIDVCLLSRIPVGRVTSHRHLRFKNPLGQTRHFERDVLEVELLPEGGLPFEMWVVHLKSNSGGREQAEPIRLGETMMIRRLLDRRLKADPGARIVVCGDFNDTWESKSVQTIVGTGPFALQTAASTLPKSKRVSYNQAPYRSMIDFLLYSDEMAKHYVPDSYGIMQGSIETIGADHNPVSALFRMKGSNS